MKAKTLYIATHTNLSTISNKRRYKRLPKEIVEDLVKELKKLNITTEEKNDINTDIIILPDTEKKKKK